MYLYRNSLEPSRCLSALSRPTPNWNLLSAELARKDPVREAVNESVVVFLRLPADSAAAVAVREPRVCFRATEELDGVPTTKALQRILTPPFTHDKHSTLVQYSVAMAPALSIRSKYMTTGLIVSVQGLRNLGGDRLLISPDA